MNQSYRMRILFFGPVLAIACGGEGPPAREGGIDALSAGSAVEAPLPQEASSDSLQSLADRFRTGPPPAPAPGQLALVGDYVAGGDTLSILEDGGGLFALPWGGEREAWTPEHASGAEEETVVFRDRAYRRLHLGGAGGESFRIDPLGSPEELREEALAATPPVEEGSFRPSELVDVTALDSTIHLDIRYAGTNNFMGQVFYSSPRAFLQRPAAEAVARANTWLRGLGYGLLIHDGYRPWYVTKMFWDATPDGLKLFVADPAAGSRHNRGCAVDLTLYDLDTGEPVVMPAGFDEMSPRSHVDYCGGTSRQRWHRELLRTAMEAHGFTVYPAEWWHYDHRDWRSYRIENVTFEEIGGGEGS